MPELPEVESTARFLHERIAGDQVAEVAVLWPRTVGDVTKFETSLTGAKIAAVFRRAKFVCFRCLDSRDREFFLAAHMRMSGSFDVLKTQLSPEKHDRFLLKLITGRTVAFCDPRKFGRAKIVDNFQAFSEGLGIEPLSAECTIVELQKRLQRKRALKPLLLDQSVVAGLGNIYVDEALWHARLHPLKRADLVKDDEVRRLHAAIQKVLTKAIAQQGTDFGDNVVEMGNYKPVAYGRTGKPCSRCKSPIARILVGQQLERPVCGGHQKRPRSRPDGAHFCQRHA